MTDHTPTPWRVFINTDGTKLVGIGGQDGVGILDCGFGVWAWDDPEGIANANLVVKAVNNHNALVKALEEIEDLGANGATAARLGNIAHAALLSLRHVGCPSQREGS